MAHCFKNSICEKDMNYRRYIEDNCMSRMDTFEAEIRRLLENMSPNVFCAIDPMPTWLVKECLAVLISRFTKIVNKSLFHGVFPRSMKAVLQSAYKRGHSIKIALARMKYDRYFYVNLSS